MKIKITTDAGVSPAVTEVLGDDSAKAYISGYLPESSSEIEVAPLLRAASLSFFDRLNVKTVIPFRVDRSHTSEALALKFVNDHLRRVPRKGIIEISQQGNGAFTLWLVGALARVHVVSLNSSSVIEYEIWGGQLLASNPAASGGGVPGP